MGPSVTRRYVRRLDSAVPTLYKYIGKIYHDKIHISRDFFLVFFPGNFHYLAGERSVKVRTLLSFQPNSHIKVLIWWHLSTPPNEIMVL